MSLNYENLDEKIRQFMAEEVKLDISKGTFYISPRLNEQGENNYPALLIEAVESYDDAWLANELHHRRYIKSVEQRRKYGGGFSVAKVPVTAADTLAEGEFNRFYVRGLCALAIQEGINEVEVYRGKFVRQPRPGSEAMIGKKLPAEGLLKDLRQSPGVEPALGLPPGPNSGLTVRLP